MSLDDSSLEPTAAELTAGFSAQTLPYPDVYELPQLGGTSQVQRERTVALVIDDANRIRRRRTGPGYLHEVYSGAAWATETEFESLDDVLAGPLYRQWKNDQPPAEDPAPGEEGN